LYGMNFEYMPELKYPMAYPIVIAVMICITIFIYIWFRRRGWI
jgi:magnesium transporter